ncbi:hypothetical protein BDW66DRAFT_162723 [Aspergillus desertorum]
MSSFVQALLSNPGVPLQARQHALDRASSDPGLPTPSPTSSFWLRSPHPDLSRNGPGQDHNGRPAIVMLEARFFAATAEEFADLEREHGLGAAEKIMRFKLAHLQEILAVADEYGVTEEAQARQVQFLSVYFDQGSWREARRRFQRLKEGLPEVTVEWTVYGKDEVPKEFSLPHAQGIVAGPAGAIWPYRFVRGVLARLRAKYPKNLQIETSTPVTNIEGHSNGSSNGPGRIFSVRGQMSAQYPGSRFRCQGKQHSWLFNYDRGAGEMMMFGGGISDIGVSTDSKQSLHVDIHLSGALSAVFGLENWGSTPGVEQMWTGNMGFSADGLPWVGRLPASVTQRGPVGMEDRGGEWISAAFSGEGMVLAWLCGKALGRMLLLHDGELLDGDCADLSWFPEQMLVTEVRANTAALPRSAASVSPNL